MEKRMMNPTFHCINPDAGTVCLSNGLKQNLPSGSGQPRTQMRQRHSIRKKGVDAGGNF